MKVKDAIKKCKLLLQTYDFFNQDATAIKTLVDAAEKQRKYRWHKYSNNGTVPELFERVLTVDKRNVYRVLIYGYADRDNVLHKDFIMPDVLAWRYIEPFEVE